MDMRFEKEIFVGKLDQAELQVSKSEKDVINVHKELEKERGARSRRKHRRCRTRAKESKT